MDAPVTDISWGCAAQLILGADPQLAVYGQGIIWLHKVELFRRAEEARMYLQKPAARDLALHKDLLRRLIADGEHLLRLIDQNGFVSNSEGITEADLEATLQSLQADYRGWHEPMPAAAR